MNPKNINKTMNNTHAIIELSDTELTEVSGGAQVDYFLRIDGVPGESTDRSGFGGGGGAGKVSMQDFNF